MNRSRQDDWLTQLPALSYPPTSASQQADTSVLVKPKQQNSEIPVYPHPESVVGNQLPPIRNLVPGLWEPGTSKSSQQTPSDEPKNGSPIYPLRTLGPAWNSGSTDGNDRHIPRPQLETGPHEDESKRDTSRQVNEFKKRPPPSPIERADHVRTAPSNSVINSNRDTVSNVQKPSQTSKYSGGRPEVRPRSSSETARPTNGRPGSGSQPSHQQEILRDPVSTFWSHDFHAGDRLTLF